MATTDIPNDINTGEPRYELEEPLERLQSLLNQKNVDIESLDIRGEGQGIMFRTKPKELRMMIDITNENPEYVIKSSGVRDLNDKFDKTLINSNPNYIFRNDMTTRNNRNLIKTGIRNFASERDFFVSPQPLDTQQKIFDLLKK